MKNASNWASELGIDNLTEAMIVNIQRDAFLSGYHAVSNLMEKFVDQFIETTPTKPEALPEWPPEPTNKTNE
jgi:hypothetical protein